MFDQCCLVNSQCNKKEISQRGINSDYLLVGKAETNLFIRSVV